MNSTSRTGSGGMLNLWAAWNSLCHPANRFAVQRNSARDHTRYERTFGSPQPGAFENSPGLVGRPRTHHRFHHSDHAGGTSVWRGAPAAEQAPRSAVGSRRENACREFDGRILHADGHAAHESARIVATRDAAGLPLSCKPLRWISPSLNYSHPAASFPLAAMRAARSSANTQCLWTSISSRAPSATTWGQRAGQHWQESWAACHDRRRGYAALVRCGSDESGCGFPVTVNVHACRQPIQGPGFTYALARKSSRRDHTSRSQSSIWAGTLIFGPWLHTALLGG
jgi:hypothetical protein